MNRIIGLMVGIIGFIPCIQAQIVSPGIEDPRLASDTSGKQHDSQVMIVSPGIMYRDISDENRPPEPGIVSPGVKCPGIMDGESASGPYFGQTAPGTIPKRFAPSKIPLGAWGVTFSPDGMECFITQNIDNVAVIKTSKEADGTWPNLTTAAFSGTYWDMESHITPAGNRMYFGSQRPLEGAPPDILHQWYVDKTDTGWSEPKPMDPPLRGIFMMFPSVAVNGNMYFTSGTGPIVDGISVSRWVDSCYQEPELLSDSINYLYWAAHPFIAPDESYIIFDAKADSTVDITDLFISFRRPDGAWTKAKKLPSSMTPGGCAYVSRDGKYFFFWKTNCTMWVDAGFIEKMRPLMGPYLGQTPPDTIPVRFVPPSLQANNEWFWHGSPSFSPDLTEMFFVKYLKSSDRTEINYMKMTDGLWSDPVRPSFGSTSYIDNNPLFSLSGDTVYFYSQRPGGPYFFVVRQNDDWSEPVSLYVPYPDTLSTTWQFSITRNGTFYFDLWQKQGDIDIYSSVKVDGQYMEPVKLGPEINSPYQDWGACLDDNERILIFSSNRPDGFGLHDLYISYKNEGNWIQSQNLGSNINGPNEDGFPSLTPDGKYFFFTTAKYENGDLGYNPYWVKATTVAPVLGLPDNIPGPRSIRLEQNYPNPSTGKTTIGFSLLKAGHCNLAVYNVFGQEMKRLLDEEKAPGSYRIEAELSDLKPGIYFYMITSDNEMITKTMIIL